MAGGRHPGGMADVTALPGWRMGALVLVCSFGLFFGGLYVAVFRPDGSALRLASLGAAFFGVVIGVRLITPSRHDTE